MTNTPIDPLAIIELTNLKAAGKLEHLARHPQLGMKPEWIGELSRNKDYPVRLNLARNPAIADCPDVRYWLARNLAIPTSTASNATPWQTAQQATQAPTI